MEQITTPQEKGMEQTKAPQELCSLVVDGDLKEEIADEYIVSLKEDADVNAQIAWIESEIEAKREANRNDQSTSSRRITSKLKFKFSFGYSGLFSPTLLAKIRQSSAVKFVEGNRRGYLH